MRVVRVLLAAAICSLFISAASCGGQTAFISDSQSETKLTIVSGDGEHHFELELARSDEEKRIGLMHREALAEQSGMLFDFGPEPQHVAIWMKNTLIPLDIIFIDAEGYIVRITEEATPLSLQSMPSGQPILSVLEINGGEAAKLGVKVGDQVRHPWFSAERN